MPVPAATNPSPLTEEGKESLLDFVKDAITQTLDDSLYQLTDLPGFVADTNTVGPFANAQRQGLRLACRSYARGNGPQNLPGFDALWGGICQPYLDDIGETPDPGKGAGLPFTGGQCAGVFYDLRASVTTFQGTFPVELLGIRGPIGSPFGFNSFGGQSLQAGYSFENYGVSTGDGQQTLSGITTGTKLNSFTVTRSGGAPDNCGDPPPEYDPPKVKPGLPVVPKTPIDLPGVGPVPFNITFNPDGTLNIEAPDLGIEVDVPIDFGGDDGGGGGGGAPPGAPPGDVGDPGSPSPVAGGEEEEGEAPAGSVLTGLRVQITAFPNSRNKYTEEVYRGAYYAYMGVPGLLDLDFGGAMVRSDQFLLAEKDNLTAWRVYANTGYELVVTPYYREVEAE